MSAPCVCSICSCGQHHCRTVAEAQSRGLPPSFDTTNKVDYPQHGSIKREQPKVRAGTLRTNQGEIDGLTIYTQDYPPKSVPRATQPPREGYRPNDAPFINDTTARCDFIPHTCSRTAPIIPPVSRAFVTAGPSDFTTTNGDALKQWPTQKQAPFKPQSSAKDLAPFEGQSSYQNDFIPKDAERARPVVRGDTLKQGDGPIESSTTMRATFAGAAGSRAAPFRPEQQRALPAQFDGTTTMQRDFAGAKGERVAPIRPADGRRSLGPFEGTTHYNESFLPHAVGPRTQHRPEERRPDQQPFEGSTTMQTDFVPKGAAKRDAIRPAERRRTSAPGEYNTSYGDTMKQWSVTRATPKVAAPTLRPEGEFRGTTEMRDSFTPKANTRSAPIVPLAVLAPSGHFTGDTSYKNSYAAPPPPCAVLRMPRGLWQECGCSGTSHPHSHVQTA